MCTPRRTDLLVALTLAAAAACGDSTGPSSGGGAGMTARVDGQDWTAHELSIAASAGQSGSFTITGSEPVGTGSRSITLTLFNVRGTGTYPFGTTATMVGGRALFSESGAVWATPNSGAAGTFTLSTLSPTRIAGTFRYDAELSSGSSGTQSHSITNGTFDMPLQTTGSLPAVPDNAGSVVTAQVGSDAFNAANGFATTSITGNGLGFNANNLVYQIGLSLDGVTAPGTYTVNQPAGRLLFVTGFGGGQNNPACCWGPTSGDTGTVTITSVSATRMRGTFSGTLQPQPGSGKTQALIITNGAFDMGR